VSHNTVVRVGDEMPPAEAMLIEPGAKRVESRLTRLARELREIDTIRLFERYQGAPIEIVPASVSLPATMRVVLRESPPATSEYVPALT
jgi:hypothetical protein